MGEIRSFAEQVGCYPCIALVQVLISILDYDRHWCSFNRAYSGASSLDPHTCKRHSLDTCHPRGRCLLRHILTAPW